MLITVFVFSHLNTLCSLLPSFVGNLLLNIHFSSSTTLQHNHKRVPSIVSGYWRWLLCKKPRLGYTGRTFRSGSSGGVEEQSELNVVFTFVLSLFRYRLAAGTSEKIQLSSLIAAFQVTRDLIVAEA